MQIPERAVPAVVVNCLFPILAFFVVCARVNTRVFMLHNVGVDDYLIVGSVVASIGFWAIIMLQIRAGLGRQITLEELPGFLYALWATVPIYNLSLILSKLSIAVQCYRVLRTQAMQRFLRIFIGVLVVYGLFAVFGTIFNCWPIAAYWGATQGITGVCMDRNALTFSIAGINITTDIMLVAVPIPLLWNLQIPKKQKIILMGVFGVGTVACVTSIIRLHSLYTIGIAPLSEQSVQGVDIALMSSLEINLAIICASVPALKPLAVKLFPKMLLSDLYAKSRRAYGNVTGSGNRSGSRHLRSQQNDRSHRKEMAVVVQQSIEMESVPTAGVDDHLERNVSRDGSEKNLVSATSWKVDIYATNDSRDGRKKHVGRNGSLHMV